VGRPWLTLEALLQAERPLVEGDRPFDVLDVEYGVPEPYGAPFLLFSRLFLSGVNSHQGRAGLPFA
jgi:hypothetical protein